MLIISIRKAEKLPGINNAFISFASYNADLIDSIRQLTDRRYNAKTKEWEVGIEKLEYILTKAKDFPIDITVKGQKQSVSKIPKEYQFKTKPFQHQIVGVEYGLNHDVYLLCDEMGCGKSKQLIDLACIRKLKNKIKHCIIICGINSIKYNWLGEISTHSNEKGWVLGTRFNKNGKISSTNAVADRIYDLSHREEFFLITNIESFRNDDFVKEFKKQKFEMIAIDESHFIRTNSAAQSKGLLACDSAKYKIAMSGTPVVNKPLDIYTTLKWLGLERANFSTFKSFYCDFGGFGGHEVTGYRNLSKLRETLKDHMLRRLKESVLDLPGKIIQTEYVEMSHNQWLIYNEVKESVLQNIDLITASPDPLAQLLRLRQATDYTGLLSSTIRESAKLDRLEEMVEDLVSNGRKCLIFSNWTSITKVIKDRFSKYKIAYITGEIDPAAREVEKNKFQNEKDCVIALGTIGAMGTGLTLTAATTVFFFDLPWHKAAFDQCSDRAYRIGQNCSVNVIKLIAKNTIDEGIDNIVIKKGEMADMLVDGKVKGLSKQLLLNIIN